MFLNVMVIDPDGNSPDVVSPIEVIQMMPYVTQRYLPLAGGDEQEAIKQALLAKKYCKAIEATAPLVTTVMIGSSPVGPLVFVQDLLENTSAAIMWVSLGRSQALSLCPSVTACVRRDGSGSKPKPSNSKVNVH